MFLHPTTRPKCWHVAPETPFPSAQSIFTLLGWSVVVLLSFPQILVWMLNITPARSLADFSVIYFADILLIRVLLFPIYVKGTTLFTPSKYLKTNSHTMVSYSSTTVKIVVLQLAWFSIIINVPDEQLTRDDLIQSKEWKLDTTGGFKPKHEHNAQDCALF